MSLGKAQIVYLTLNVAGRRPVEIVGVVGDVKHVSLEDTPTIDIYLPVAQVHEDGVSALTNSQYWILRSTTDPQFLEAAIRRELRSVDAEVATKLDPLKALRD